jgi:hypothetical protein
MYMFRPKVKGGHTQKQRDTQQPEWSSHRPFSLRKEYRVKGRTTIAGCGVVMLSAAVKYNVALIRRLGRPRSAAHVLINAALKDSSF